MRPNLFFIDFNCSGDRLFVFLRCIPRGGFPFFGQSLGSIIGKKSPFSSARSQNVHNFSDVILHVLRKFFCYSFSAGSSQSIKLQFDSSLFSISSGSSRKKSYPVIFSTSSTVTTKLWRRRLVVSFGTINPIIFIGGVMSRMTL